MATRTNNRSTRWALMAAATATVLGFGALTLPAEAGPPHARQAMMGQSEEVRDLRRDVAALSLYHELDLTPAQEARLSEILTPHHQAMRSIIDGKEELEKRAVRILEKAKSELQRASSISDATREELEAIREAHRALGEERKTHAEPTRDAVLEALTAEQRSVVENFQPGPALGLQQNSASPGLKRVDRLREMTPEEVEQRTQQITQRSGAGTNGDPARAEMRAQKFREFVSEIQAVPDSEWPQQREIYAEQIAQRRAAHGRGGSEGRGPGMKGKRGPNKAGTMLLLTETFYQALSG